MQLKNDVTYANKEQLTAQFLSDTKTILHSVMIK